MVTPMSESLSPRYMEHREYRKVMLTICTLTLEDSTSGLIKRVREALIINWRQLAGHLYSGY
jgi:hypothetical protein